MSSPNNPKILRSATVKTALRALKGFVTMVEKNQIMVTNQHREELINVLSHAHTAIHSIQKELL